MMELVPYKVMRIKRGLLIIFDMPAATVKIPTHRHCAWLWRFGRKIEHGKERSKKTLETSE